MKSNKITSKKFSIIIFLFSFFLFSCKKIHLPNEEAKLLIGRWAIVSKKGSVVTSNPYAVATDLSDFNDIIFKKNGRFKEREWSVINYGEKYEISVRVSATGEEENVIKYSKRGSQLFKVTSDSLFLIDEAGPWTWKYSRK